MLLRIKSEGRHILYIEALYSDNIFKVTTPQLLLLD